MKDLGKVDSWYEDKIMIIVWRVRPGEYGATVLGDEPSPVLGGGPVEPGGLGRLHVGEVTGAVHRHAAEHVEPTHTIQGVPTHI